MEMVFPADVNKIFIPRELDGSKGKLVLEVAHRDPNAVLFWHMDNQFKKETHYFHQIAIDPSAGWHTITIVDGKGNMLVKKFKVLE
jgi:penicillin-binding protein 1C